MRSIALSNDQFIAASEIPKSTASPRVRRRHERTPGRLTASSANAENTSRSSTVPVGPARSNRPFATALPTCTEAIAPSTRTGAGTPTRGDGAGRGVEAEALTCRCAARRSGPGRPGRAYCQVWPGRPRWRRRARSYRRCGGRPASWRRRPTRAPPAAARCPADPAAVPVGELLVVVDAANVVGARPDGWWRDRPGAARRLYDRLVALAGRGLPPGTLPGDPAVRFVLVVEGRA